MVTASAESLSHSIIRRKYQRREQLHQASNAAERQWLNRTYVGEGLSTFIAVQQKKKGCRPRP